MLTALIRLDDVSLAFGDQVVHKNANLQIESGERLCLIGRNGAGKSSTLKLLMGELEPDEGKIENRPGINIAMLNQILSEGSEQEVWHVVAEGMREQTARIEAFRKISADTKTQKTKLRELEILESAIETGGGWSVSVQVDAMITQLELPSHMKMNELSGGWRRRVALAQALVGKPDLLLLDEPTNHLDISTIEWLEEKVRGFEGAVLFVTHDRGFVERVASRIIEIDRGHLRSWPGGYRDYLRQKSKADKDEDRRNILFDKKLAEEEVWIRRGIKARESRNEGRVRALEAMREEHSKRIKRARSARIYVNESNQLSGKKVIEARNISHGYGGETLLKDFSLRITRGERIGIIGNNGVGKSTLLRILLGELKPDSGSIKFGTHLETAYFDQLRRELDTTKTVADIVGEGRDYIQIQGKKKHIIAYLTDFLFSAKRAMTRVAALSGGERNRVILAKLFTRSSNLLVLDEPTNDLDVETLEALEARLSQYNGTLLVVSHDRYFLDKVVTSTLVFEGNGTVKRYPGGYSDWVRHHHELAVADESTLKRNVKKSTTPPMPSPAKKLSYKLQRELDALPAQIKLLEADVSTIQMEVDADDFYLQPHERIRDKLEKLSHLQDQLEIAVERWAELEGQAQASRGS
ncbi:MAG: ATP-binding cassette domain-containing protein [Pseudomonadota bacterium]|nr:ATP-binding cassette domain-containing protein [Pseudomonadota bacterium]